MSWSTVAAIGTQAMSSAAQWWGNHREAKMTRQWQERMFKNRHQWEVADLKAAGLNPVLSAMNGGGSVPSGATAQMGLMDFANSAIRAREVSRENEVRQESKQLLQEQTNSAIAQRHLISSQNHKLQAETEAILANAYPSILKQQEIHNSPELQKIIKKEAWADSLGRYSNSAGTLFDAVRKLILK